MVESGIYRTPPLQGWQRSTVIAGANVPREPIARTPGDPKVRAYEGLLDLLAPSRMLARKQRERAEAARHAATAHRQERRSQERRSADRCTANLGPPPGGERRTADRRSGSDHRRP